MSDFVEECCFEGGGFEIFFEGFIDIDNAPDVYGFIFIEGSGEFYISYWGSKFFIMEVLDLYGDVIVSFFDEFGDLF